MEPYIESDKSKTIYSILVGILLLSVLSIDLLIALFCGFLVYELVHVLAPRLQSKRLSHRGQKLTALVFLSLFIVLFSTLIVILSHNFIRGPGGGLEALTQKMIEILRDNTSFPDWLTEYLPEDLENLKETLTKIIVEHRVYVQNAGKNMGIAIAHALIGLVIGGLACVQDKLPENLGPLGKSLVHRMKVFGNCFRQVVFAQVKISAINCLFTGIYLKIFLPLLGVHLPLSKSLVAFTFFSGLLPVFGNIISNTAIVIISLSSSLSLAIGSLIFLIVIHKLEYFLNAKIIGTRIRAQAWELLLAMLFLEAIFGLKGLIAAPVYYAYLKSELREHQLI